MFGTILILISILGTLLVNKKNVYGQWCWAVCNVGWFVYDINLGAYSQAVLAVIYLGMCFHGIYLWNNGEKEVS